MYLKEGEYIPGNWFSYSVLMHKLSCFQWNKTLIWSAHCLDILYIFRTDLVIFFKSIIFHVIVTIWEKRQALSTSLWDKVQTCSKHILPATIWIQQIGFSSALKINTGNSKSCEDSGLKGNPHEGITNYICVTWG